MDEIIIELRRDSTTYDEDLSLRYWTNQSFRDVIDIGEAGLFPDGPVSANLPDMRWQDVINILTSSDPSKLASSFDARAQHEVGVCLYKAIVARVAPKADSAVSLLIVTSDEFLMRLPWVLLGDGPNRLVEIGWSISVRFGELSDKFFENQVTLRPRPRILIAAPSPTSGYSETGRQDHVDDITRRCLHSDNSRITEDQIVIAHTWYEFQTRVKEESNGFDVVYFYGHGEGDWRTSKLVFEDAESESKIIPIGDVKSLFASVEWRPKLIYLNCCLGDASGALGAGTQLISVADAVISNRAVAWQEAAQRQGLEILGDVLLERSPPEETVGKLQQDPNALGLSVDDPRWFTPVLHRNYPAGKWVGNGFRWTQLSGVDPRWSYMVDRQDQWAILRLKVLDLLENLDAGFIPGERLNHIHGFITLGDPDHGVSDFVSRIKNELPVAVSKHKSEYGYHEVSPDWEDLRNGCPEDMTLRAFGFHPRKDREQDIRSGLDARFGALAGGTVVLVNHDIIRRETPISMGELSHYFDYLDGVLAPVFSQSRYLLVVSIPMEVRDTGKAASILQEEVFRPFANSRKRGRNSTFRLLPGLRLLTAQDLLEFIEDFRIPIPNDVDLVRLLDDIVESTGGKYSDAVQLLKDAIENGFQGYRNQASRESSEDDDWL